MLNAIKYFFEIILPKRKERENPDLPLQEDEEKNPYLWQLREIMEQVLKIRKIPYEQFMPIIIDGKDSAASLMAAELLGRDLNRLVIMTDNPEYFLEYADTMYEEEGLIAEIFSKDFFRMAELPLEGMYGNVILDFEESGEKESKIKFGNKTYIPIFKKRWERAGNLDIAIPIGYNTVIVKGSTKAGAYPYYDKFEKAFYENE